MPRRDPSKTVSVTCFDQTQNYPNPSPVLWTVLNNLALWKMLGRKELRKGENCDLLAGQEGKQKRDFSFPRKVREREALGKRGWDVSL